MRRDLMKIRKIMAERIPHPFLHLNSHSTCPILDCHIWLFMNSGPSLPTALLSKWSQMLPDP